MSIDKYSSIRNFKSDKLLGDNWSDFMANESNEESIGNIFIAIEYYANVDLDVMG